MNGSLLQQWINESEEMQRLYAQEKLILEVSERIMDVLEKRNLNRVQLADVLGTSKSHVTQLLNGTRNMTLRTLADIACKLNYRVAVRFTEWRESDDWQHAEAVVHRRRLPLQLSPVDAANGDDWSEPRLLRV